jgi:cupin superfamily acireductone dioxygenase involved in methionine salvage
MSVVDITNTIKFQNLIEEISNKFPFDDTFITDKAFRLDNHSHEDAECRLFISGDATFWINGEKINCVPGTYIEIEPGISHEFEYKGGNPLKVLRFFSGVQSWTANFC